MMVYLQIENNVISDKQWYFMVSKLVKDQRVIFLLEGCLLCQEITHN